jgi:hypothetical protein
MMGDAGCKHHLIEQHHHAFREPFVKIIVQQDPGRSVRRADFFLYTWQELAFP